MTLYVVTRIDPEPIEKQQVYAEDFAQAAERSRLRRPGYLLSVAIHKLKNSVIVRFYVNQDGSLQELGRYDAKP